MSWQASVAPMMDWTNRHCRVFHRTLNSDVRLYTEMITTGALRYGDQARHLDFSEIEQPLALQLGGSEPADLACSATLGAKWGYDEINLNCGCPSDRVRSGRFGACLMAEPATVRDACKAMLDAVSIPVTVKCRLGIDDQDAEEDFNRFIDVVADSGVRVFIVHARKAWLQGLSPKQNRDIPPLDYDTVVRLKRRRPDLTVVLNGGLKALDPYPGLDGVMVGREAYSNPWILSDGRKDRREVIESLYPYVEGQLKKGVPLGAMTRHMLGLFNGLPGARAWRRYLCEQAFKTGAGLAVLTHALSLVKAEPAFAPADLGRAGPGQALQCG